MISLEAGSKLTAKSVEKLFNNKTFQKMVSKAPKEFQDKVFKLGRSIKDSTFFEKLKSSINAMYYAIRPVEFIQNSLKAIKAGVSKSLSEIKLEQSDMSFVKGLCKVLGKVFKGNAKKTITSWF